MKRRWKSEQDREDFFRYSKSQNDIIFVMMDRIAAIAQNDIMFTESDFEYEKAQLIDLSEYVIRLSKILEEKLDNGMIEVE